MNTLARIFSWIGAVFAWMGEKLRRDAAGRVQCGVSLIAIERCRQMREEGWTPEHDDEHCIGELAMAATCYVMPSGLRSFRLHFMGETVAGGTKPMSMTVFDKLWPWAHAWWRPHPDDRIRELVKAGALIAAEIDRIHRRDARNARRQDWRNIA